MLNIYKTQYEIRDDDTDKTHSDIISVFACNIAEALETMKIKKPKNVNIIYSSMFINKQVECDYPFVDKIFTVYDKDYIKDNKININCGGRSCLSCHLLRLPDE